MNVRRLCSSADSAFPALVRIYEESFPASERKSVDRLTQMIEQPEYYFLMAYEHGAVTGFSIALALTGTNASLLEYMAIGAEHRGRGLGQQLFCATASYAPLAGLHLLMEVESDRHPGADQISAARRKKFYQRLGCGEIAELTYRMPQVSDADPPPMNLLLYRSVMPRFVHKPELRSWLEAIYTQVYGVALPDARIHEMLHALSEDVPLL